MEEDGEGEEEIQLSSRCSELSSPPPFFLVPSSLVLGLLVLVLLLLLSTAVVIVYYVLSTYTYVSSCTAKSWYL